MIVKDKRKKCTTLLKDIAFGEVFEDIEGNLFMKICLDGSCYPSGLSYETIDAVVDLNDFEVYFFSNTADVCLVRNAELTLS